MRVHYCEHEQGPILGEVGNADGRPAESLIDCLESSYQHKRMMPKASKG